MATFSKENAYREAASGGATQIGLLVLVYDALSKDLQQAGLAVQCNDIPRRCKASNHALALLGHLDSWITYLDDPRLVLSLRHFYDFLRRRIVELQDHGTEEDFQALSTFVVETRAAWQQKELVCLRNVADSPHVGAMPATGFAHDENRESVRWSA